MWIIDKLFSKKYLEWDEFSTRLENYETKIEKEDSKYKEIRPNFE